MAVSFANAFLSYLLLFLIIVVLGGVAVAVGITLRKKKNAKGDVQATTAKEK